MARSSPSAPPPLPDFEVRAKNHRHYEPIARLLPVSSWSAGDQAAWERACLKAGPLDPSGGLAHLGLLSLDQHRRSWARYRSFLWTIGELVETERPAERLTYDRGGRFILSLRDRMTPLSVLECIHTLARTIEAMEPDHDWGWVRRHPTLPRNAEVQLSLKRIVPPDPVELLAAALAYCDSADSQPTSVPSALAFRDGLIVAFATYFATRRKNIFEMTLGEHLIIDDDRTRLRLDSSIKNGEIIESIVPETLEPYLRRYLTHHRKVVLGQQADPGSVWISRFGNQLSYGSLFLLFRRTGERAIGRRINVHSVRYAMATAILDNDVDDVALASAGLAHRGHSSVRRIYDKGGPQRANRAWRAILRRRSLRN